MRGPRFSSLRLSREIVPDPEFGDCEGVDALDLRFNLELIRVTRDAKGFSDKSVFLSWAGIEVAPIKGGVVIIYRVKINRRQGNGFWHVMNVFDRLQNS